jgi:DNA-binding Xre family transcriptional regulator
MKNIFKGKLNENMKETENDNNVIYENIKRLCKEKGMMLKELEAKAGFGKNGMHHIKSSDPKLSTLEKIAKVLECEVDDIRYGKIEEKPQKQELTDIDTLLINLCSQMNFMQKVKFAVYGQDLLDNKENKEK